MRRRGALVAAATVARKLGRHPSTVVRWIRTGKVRGTCVPKTPEPGQRRRWYVYRTAYQELLGDQSAPDDGQ